MKLENLRSLIRESINEYIKEIDDQGTGAMYEAKKTACEEAIRKREDKLRSIDENEELKEMVDGAKLKEIQKEIAELKKYHSKLEKLQGKHANKGKKKEVTTDAVTEDTPIDENDVMGEMDLEEAKKKGKNRKNTFGVDNIDAGEEDNPFDKGKTKHQPVDEDDMPKVQKMGGASNWNDRQRGLSWNSDQLYDDAQLEEGTLNESFIRMQKIAGIIK